MATQKLWRDDTAFFRKGGSGHWRDLLGEEEVARYRATVTELVPPDLAAWAHAGWSGDGSWDDCTP